MQSSSQTKRQIVYQVLTYVAMGCFIIATVILITLYMIGYRISRGSGTIIQGGLVQFGSSPSGGLVKVDHSLTVGQTPVKDTLPPGGHNVQISKVGYQTWQKNIDVLSGGILWLNYARLIPKEIRQTKLLELPAAEDSLTSSDRKQIILLNENPIGIELTAVDISSDKPKFISLGLPEDLFSKVSDSSESYYSLISFDSSNRYLLVRHQFSGSEEWVYIDIKSPEKSVNLSNLFKVPLSDLQFSQNGRVIYSVVDGDIRRLDLNGSTLSTPLVANVKEYSLFDDGLSVAYVSKIDPETNRRSVGYLTENATMPKTVRSYSDDPDTPLHIEFSKYFNEHYVTISYGGVVDILKGDIPKSDSDKALSLKAINTTSLSSTVEKITVQTGGRLVIIKYGQGVVVHDLELLKQSNLPLVSEDPGIKMGWLDGYMVWYLKDNKLFVSDFDGDNLNQIFETSTHLSPVLSQNGKYIFSIEKVSDKKSNLMQLNLTTE